MVEGVAENCSPLSRRTTKRSERARAIVEEATIPHQLPRSALELYLLERLQRVSTNSLETSRGLVTEVATSYRRRKTLLNSRQDCNCCFDVALLVLLAANRGGPLLENGLFARYYGYAFDVATHTLSVVENVDDSFLIMHGTDQLLLGTRFSSLPTLLSWNL
jgi:hypothetical protein